MKKLIVMLLFMTSHINILMADEIDAVQQAMLNVRDEKIPKMEEGKKKLNDLLSELEKSENAILGHKGDANPIKEKTSGIETTIQSTRTNLESLLNIANTIGFTENQKRPITSTQDTLSDIEEMISSAQSTPEILDPGLTNIATKISLLRKNDIPLVISKLNRVKDELTLAVNAGLAFVQVIQYMKHWWDTQFKSVVTDAIEAAKKIYDDTVYAITHPIETIEDVGETIGDTGKTVVDEIGSWFE